jgi:hypothetical protein
MIGPIVVILGRLVELALAVKAIAQVLVRKRPAPDPVDKSATTPVDKVVDKSTWPPGDKPVDKQDG